MGNKNKIIILVLYNKYSSNIAKSTHNIKVCYFSLTSELYFIPAVTPNDASLSHGHYDKKKTVREGLMFCSLGLVQLESITLSLAVNNNKSHSYCLGNHCGVALQQNSIK